MCVCLSVSGRLDGPGGLTGASSVQVYNAVVGGCAPSLGGVPSGAGGEDVGSVHTGGDNGDVVIAGDQLLSRVVVPGC